MRTTLDIVVVNWNAGPLLRDCVAAVDGSDRQGFELSRFVIVDNASRDGSADQLHFPNLPLSIVKNSHNVGFAAACNQGAAGSTADFILFLNPDTKVYKDSLQRSIELMLSERNSQVGILGVSLIDSNGEVSRSCARFPSWRSIVGKSLGLTGLLPGLFPDHFYEAKDHLHSHPVDQVMGAYFMIRGPLFRSLGGFDERFFVYYEEVDLSLRALHEGGISYFDSNIRVFHSGCGTTDQVKALRLFYSTRSRLQYVMKHFGFAQATVSILATCFVEPVARLLRAALRFRWSELKETAQAYSMLYRGLPEILASRPVSGRAAVAQRVG